MQSLVNCIRAGVGSEPCCAAREGWWPGQGPGNGAWGSHSSGRRRVGSEEDGGGIQDVLSCYLANTSSSLVSVAGFCCRARQLWNSEGNQV